MAGANARTRASLDYYRVYWRGITTPAGATEEALEAGRAVFGDAVDELEAAIAVADAFPLDDDQLDKYFRLLEGPEGCNFVEGKNGPEWDCGGWHDKSRSQKILAEHFGLNDVAIEIVHRIVNVFGGHCDCEILFNAAGRMHDAWAPEEASVEATGEAVQAAGMED